MKFLLIICVLHCYIFNSETIYIPGELETKPSYVKTWRKIALQPHEFGNQVIMHHNYSRVLVHNQNSQQQNVTNTQNIAEPSTIEINDKLQSFNYKRENRNYPVENRIELNRFSNMAFEQCPPNVTGRLVYLWSCSQYLNCWKGRGYIQNCAHGTLFNPVTLECDYQFKVNCISGAHSQRVRSEKMIVIDSSVPQCKPNFSGLMAHPFDCKKFLNCANGQTFIQDCGPGTAFNEAIQACDFLENVQCGQTHDEYNYDIDIRLGKGHSQVQGQQESKCTSNCPEQTYPKGFQSYPDSQLNQWTNRQIYPGHVQTYPTQHREWISRTPDSRRMYGGYFQTQTTNYRPPQTAQLGPGQINPFIQTSNKPGESCKSDCSKPLNGRDFQSYPAYNDQHQTRQWTNRPLIPSIPAIPTGGILRENCKSGGCTRPVNGRDTQSYPTYNGQHPTVQWTNGPLIPSIPTGNIPGENCKSGGCSRPVNGRDIQSYPTYNGQHQTGQWATGPIIPSTPTGNIPGESCKSGGCSRPANGRDIQSYPTYNGQHQAGQWANRPTIPSISTSSIPGENCKSGGCSRPVNGRDFQSYPTYNVQHQTGQWANGPTIPSVPTGSIPGENCNSGGCSRPVNGRDMQSYPTYNGQSQTRQWINIHPSRSIPVGNQAASGGGYFHSSPTNYGQTLNEGGYYPSPPTDYGKTHIESESHVKEQTFSSQPWNAANCKFNCSIPAQAPVIPDGRLNFNTMDGSQWNYNHRESNSRHVKNCTSTTCVNNQEAVYNIPIYQGSTQSFGQTNVNIPAQTSTKCPPNYSGLLPHPSICEKFLNCANGATHIQNCGPGTVFNPKLKVCDWPYNVQCQSSQQQQQPDVSPPFHTQTNTNYQQSSQTSHHNYHQNYEQQTESSNPIPQFTNTNYHQTQQHVHNEKVYAVVEPESDQNFTKEFVQQGRNYRGIIGLRHDPPVIQNSTVPVTLTTSINVHESPNQKGSSITNSWKSGHICSLGEFDCSDSCISQKLVCDGNLDCSNGIDEQNCTTYLEQFMVKSNSRLYKHEIEKWLNTNLQTCAQYCLQTKIFQCKSFNFRREDNVCILSNTNVGLSGALAVAPQYDYYEMKRYSINCTNMYECPNKKCINFTQLCDGIDDCGNRIDEKNCDAQKLGYAIKLSGSKLKNEGQIEIKVFDEWGFICDDQFTLRDADVACKELGFKLGALEVKPGSYFATGLKENETFYLMDDVNCFGNETSLRDCDFSGWGVHNCMQQEVVGIVCRTPDEVCPEDYWKCDTTLECLKLEYVCDGMFDCTDHSDEGNQHCDAPVELRLVNGTSKMDGRIEIRYHGIWGTICDDDFNDQTAKVICQSLGYHGSALAKKDGAYGPGHGPIWLDQVNCFGNESSLVECSHWNWGEHNCEHDEDAGVVCSNLDMSQLEKKSKDQDHIQILAANSPEINSLEPIKCGYRGDDLFFNEENSDVHFRVVQGSIARKGDYPWQATIRVKGKSKSSHWCGAVILSNKHILTAAHCLVGFSKGSYIIRAGDYNVDEDEGSEVEAYIEDFYIHEKFRQGGHMNNDIALIRLKGNGLHLSKQVQPICLPETDTIYRVGLNCTISGFGSIESGKSTSSRLLRAGWVLIQSDDVCKMPQVYGDAITDGMFCAGSLDEGIDSCDGDSGGPLVCLDKGLFTLYGLTSWGQRCGEANKPGVYVKVTHYKNWIENKIRETS